MFGRIEALLLASAVIGNVALGGCSGAIKEDKKALGLGASSSGGSTADSGGTSATSGGTTGDGNSTGGSLGNGTGGNHPVPVIDPTNGSSGEGGGQAMEGDGTPEVCDGIDNDHNGIIDDVDVGHDGVCDCLNIGTIGQIGPWSNGGDIFASWLDARTPQGAVALDDQVLTPDLLKKLEVIVVLHVAPLSISNNGVTSAAHHEFSADEATAFGDWVNKGGGAMTTIGYTQDEANEVVNVNRLLATVGMAYSATKLDLNGFITNWDKHPITTGVSNIKIDNGVEPDGPDGTTLAHDASGRIALQVVQPKDGRVIVWGDEWITYDSEWADVNDQQVELFWLNMLKWLSPPKTCQVPIPPGLVK